MEKGILPIFLGRQGKRAGSYLHDYAKSTLLGTHAYCSQVCLMPRSKDWSVKLYYTGVSESSLQMLGVSSL
jgi:hypothetical protein